MAKKAGRPRKPYVTSTGETINGLRKRPLDGRWVITLADPPVMFSEESETRAIQRFREWEAFNSGQKLHLGPLPQTARNADDVAAFIRRSDAGRLRIKGNPELAERMQAGDYTGCTITFEPQVDEASVWPWLRELLIERPEFVAERVSIPEVARLADLPRSKPSPSPSLEALGRLYLDNTTASRHEVQKSSTMWTEFTNAMAAAGAITARDLTADLLADWLDTLNSRGMSAAYVNQWCSKIKMILSFARKRGRDVASAIEAAAVLGPVSQPK